MNDEIHDPGPKQPNREHLDLEHFVPYRLSILSNTVSGAIARLYAEEFDMTIPEWRIMAILGMAAPLSANEVAEKTRMDKVQVSRAVARLLEAGRIEREVDKADRRRSVLRLSPKGKRDHNRIAPLALASEERLLAGLSATELRQLEALLTRLQTAADAVAAADGIVGVKVPEK